MNKLTVSLREQRKTEWGRMSTLVAYVTRARCVCGGIAQGMLVFVTG